MNSTAHRLLLRFGAVTLALLLAGCPTPLESEQAADTVTYSVTYDGNGATGGMAPVDNTTYQAGSVVAVLGNTGDLVRTGYSFGGWNTAADGSGVHLSGGSSYTIGTSDVTLHAVWETAPTYTVRYNANAPAGTHFTGSVPVDDGQYLEGSPVTVARNSGELAVGGYSFVGWNTRADGSGTDHLPDTTFLMGADNRELFAQWTALPTYSVRYDANEPEMLTAQGSVPTDSNNYLAGQTVTVAGNDGALTLDAYDFVGWNTQADGLGISYPAGDSFEMGTGDVTLFALWTQKPLYTVTYYVNGATSGTVPVGPQEYFAGATVRVLGNTGNLTRAYRKFAGWNTVADGTGDQYGADATFAMPGQNVDLYAQWENYTVTYQPNGATAGSGPGGPIPVSIGIFQPAGPGDLSRAYHSFLYWNTKPDGTGAAYDPNGTYAGLDGDLTLYAIWQEFPKYNVIYQAEGVTGGSVPVDATQYYAGQSVTILGNTGDLQRSGFVFTGWSAGVTGPTYRGGDVTSMPDADLILTASWWDGAFQTTPLSDIEGRDGDLFGQSVDVYRDPLNGDYAIVGAPLDDDNGTDAGSAFIYRRASPTDAWRFVTQLLPPEVGAGDQFGRSVAISGEYAIVGADSPDVNEPGAAYIFRRTGPDTWDSGTQITAFDGAINDRFGGDVAIDGDYVVVGAHRHNVGKGAAYVFRRTGSNAWDSGTKITITYDGPPNRFGYFGFSVSISGDYLIVGAYEDFIIGGPFGTGTAYIFHRTGPNTWDSGTRLTAFDAAADDQFGYSVAIDGDYAIVSAPDKFINGAGAGAGAAYIFERTGTNAWDSGTRIIASVGAGSADWFGHGSAGVDIDGNYVIVGARNDWIGSTIRAGSVHVYRRNGPGNWVGTQILNPSPDGEDRFGNSVAIDGTLALVGMGLSGAGQAYVFERTGAQTWQLD